MRVIKNECDRSGPKAVSQYEMHVLGFVRCSGCGRAFKIRANKTGVVNVPRHSKETQ